MIEFSMRVEHPESAGIPRHGRLRILRGQLTLIRKRAEQGIPVSVECVARAEELVRSLESEELAA